MNVKASSATVEIVNLAHALDVSPDIDTPMVAWTDDVAATVEGGSLVFSNNTVEGSWPWLGGVGCGVLLSSLDTCLVTDNVSRMTTNSTFGVDPIMNDEGNPIQSLLAQVGNADFAWMMTHLYVGAVSSAQVSGNRIIDGAVDVLFSAWVGSALSPAAELVSLLTSALVYTGNVTTHCPITSTIAVGTKVDNNVSILRDTEPLTPCNYELTGVMEGEVRNMVATAGL